MDEEPAAKRRKQQQMIKKAKKDLAGAEKNWNEGGVQGDVITKMACDQLLYLWRCPEGTVEKKLQQYYSKKLADQGEKVLCLPSKSLLVHLWPSAYS